MLKNSFIYSLPSPLLSWESVPLGRAGEGLGQVIALLLTRHHQVAVVLEGIRDLVVRECHLLLARNRGRPLAVVRNHHQLVRPGCQAQPHRAVVGIALLLRHRLHLRAVGIEERDVQP